MLEEEKIQKMLRLKRYESPGDEYFQEFLEEFQKRQRTEMLKVSSFRLAWERFLLRAQVFKVPKLAYASAFSVFLVAVGIVMFDGGVSEEANGHSPADLAAQVRGANENTGNRIAPVSGGTALAGIPTEFFHATSQVYRSAPPRYILDARPVSYSVEAPLSF